MGFKKIVSIVLAAATLVCVAVEARASTLLHLDVEQAEAYLPKVITYLNILDEADNVITEFDVSSENVEVAMNGQSLPVVSVQKQQETGYGVHYFYLLDVSTSVPQYSLDRVKNAIMDQIRQKHTEDRISVITFGSSVNIVLEGNESEEDATQKIEQIMATQEKTVLYDAIMKVIDLVESKGEYSGNRSVMGVVTDGMDEQTGGITQKEIQDRVAEANIPIFAFGYQTGRTATLDTLGELARCSGGRMELIAANTAAKKINEFTQRIENTIRIECETPNNMANTDISELSVKITVDDMVYSSIAIVSYHNHIKDTIAPRIENIQVVGKDRLEIQFSEDITGIENVGMLSLKNARGKTFTVVSSVYDSNKKMATITADRTLYADSYTLVMSGVEDTSFERNKLENETYTFQTTKNSKIVIYLLVFVGLILLTAGVAVGIIIRKKTASQKESVQRSEQINQKNRVSLESLAGVEVELVIVESNRAERKVNTVVNGLYIVGREAKMCELAISDRRLSRQHFALLYDNEVLKLQDLGSTNGTRVNGMPVLRDRVIENGDVIDAGNTKMRINIK